MKTYDEKHIKNIALIGAAKSGKTTLAEALLHRAGDIGRMGRVEDATTVCDSDPQEHRRHQSISLALAPFGWKGHKINLIDTPGYADFRGETLLGLTAADQAAIVYCMTRKRVEETAAHLEAAGLKAVPYHAGLDAKATA